MGENPPDLNERIENSDFGEPYANSAVVNSIAFRSVKGGDGARFAQEFMALELLL
jgi:hypothetical protein